jgi:hypothetical protein
MEVAKALEVVRVQEVAKDPEEQQLVKCHPCSHQVAVEQRRVQVIE